MPQQPVRDDDRRLRPDRPRERSHAESPKDYEIDIEERAWLDPVKPVCLGGAGAVREQGMTHGGRALDPHDEDIVTRGGGTHGRQREPTLQAMPLFIAPLMGCRIRS